MKLSIRDVTRFMNGRLILGEPNSHVTSVAVDSRKIAAGSLFFALKGERVDGHTFALSAGRQGAAGLVVSNLDWLLGESKLSCGVIQVPDVGLALKDLGSAIRSTFKGPVVGITGSNGKTTTKQMVAGILKTRGAGLSTSGNYNSQIGLPIVLSQLADGDTWMVLEMGASAAGNIADLCLMGRPNVGIITSIGPAHLATFGSIERISETKWELMDSLPSDGCAIVPWGVAALDKHVRAFKKKMIFFGEDQSCPVRSSQVEVGERIRFRLHLGSESETVNLAMPGRVNVGNALAAAAAGWVLGYSLPEIVRGLEKFEPPKMRMEVIRTEAGAILINDAYNANPSSMQHSIQSMAESYPDRRRILVLGSMLELGDDSDRYHFHLGTEIAKTPMDRIFLYGDETRQVAEGYVSAGGSMEKIAWMTTHEEIVAALRPIAGKDAVVLFKGSRGMQLEKVLEGLINVF